MVYPNNFPVQVAERRPWIERWGAVRAHQLSDVIDVLLASGKIVKAGLDAEGNLLFLKK